MNQLSHLDPWDIGSWETKFRNPSADDLTPHNLKHPHHNHIVPGANSPNIRNNMDQYSRFGLEDRF